MKLFSVLFFEGLRRAASDTYSSLEKMGINTGGIPLDVLTHTANTGGQAPLKAEGDGKLDCGTNYQAEECIKQHKKAYVYGVCGATTKPGYTAWKKYLRDGLNLHIDASACFLKSKKTTSYVVSVVQGSSGQILAGTSVVYNSGHREFSVYVHHNHLTGDALLAAAQKDWVLSWMTANDDPKDPNQKVRIGETQVGKKNFWHKYSKNALVATVDTSSAKFPKGSVPYYFATLDCGHSHFALQGVHHIYDPTASSFKYYVFEVDTPMNPALPARSSWKINWIAAPTTDVNAGVQGQSWSGNFRASSWNNDVSTVKNTQYGPGPFTETPTYIVGFVPAWMASSGPPPAFSKPKQLATGGAGLYAPSADGFTVYARPQFCSQEMWQSSMHCKVNLDNRQWRVAYLGHQHETDCVLGGWTDWTKCDKKCGGGKMNKTRVLEQRPYGPLGKQCPPPSSRVHYKACNLQSCAPTPSPTLYPTDVTKYPTGAPTAFTPPPTPAPTPPPSPSPTGVPTRAPTTLPTPSPSPFPVYVEPVNGDTNYNYNHNILPGCQIHGVEVPAGVQCVGRGEVATCGGQTASGKTAWSLFGTLGLYLDVSAAQCKYETTPAYMVNVYGDRAHWDLRTSAAVYSMNKGGFRIIVSHRLASSTQLWRYSMKYKWSAAWVGVMGKSAGLTEWGNTAWKQYKKDVLYVDVDTSKASFQSIPRYFTAMHGENRYWGAQGIRIIYRSSPVGFRVYVWDFSVRSLGKGTKADPKTGALPLRHMTPQRANHNRWCVIWAGVERDAPNSGTTDFDDPHQKQWAIHQPVANKHGELLTLTVDTALHGYTHTPSYITSLTKDAVPMLVDGEADVFAAGPSSFTVALGTYCAHSRCFGLKFAYPDPMQRKAALQQWRVNYLAFEPASFCEVSPWGAWSACTATCGGGNATRHRRVVKKPKGPDSSSCPGLVDLTHCNSKSCPTGVPTLAPAPTPFDKNAVKVGKGGKAIGCRVTEWGKWTKCSTLCGGGDKERTRLVLQQPQLGGHGCPSLHQTQDCNTVPCGVQIGKYGDKSYPDRASSQCGATTPRGPTPWRQYGSTGLYVDIDASACHFKQTPQYVADVIGEARHWQLSGTNSIAVPAKGGFRVIVQHPAMQGLGLLLAAQYYHWNVGWIGDTSPHSGVTVKGSSGWKQTKASRRNHGKGSLFVNVDTSACHLPWPPSPRYFSSLQGKVKAHRAEGSHVVYFPTEKSFRMYVVYRGGDLTPAMAESWGWVVSWIADVSTRSGESSLDWKAAEQGNGHGIYIDVDTSSQQYRETPTYITSVTTEYMHWRVSGGSSLYSTSKKQFRLYLCESEVVASVSFAKMYKWKVNYLAFLPPAPTPAPSRTPTVAPTQNPTSYAPTPLIPTWKPTHQPTRRPTSGTGPTNPPTPRPTPLPTRRPTRFPTARPTPTPTMVRHEQVEVVAKIEGETVETFALDKQKDFRVGVAQSVGVGAMDVVIKDISSATDSYRRRLSTLKTRQPSRRLVGAIAATGGGVLVAFVILAADKLAAQAILQEISSASFPNLLAKYCGKHGFLVDQNELFLSQPKMAVYTPPKHLEMSASSSGVEEIRAAFVGCLGVVGGIVIAVALRAMLKAGNTRDKIFVEDSTSASYMEEQKPLAPTVTNQRGGYQRAAAQRAPVVSHQAIRHNYDVVEPENTVDLQGLDMYGDVEM